MERMEIYKDIALRTQGDIYIGVVGPVRTGKSTFIKRFLDLLVVPRIENEFIKERLVDELPQSGNGKTIMTTQPKFVPGEAVEISFEDGVTASVRMVDCVGYMVDGAVGHTENDAPRMVRTPWFEEEIPFEEAAEIGTRKVITDHSTIGVVVTTDGSITGIPRASYVTAEERVISELKQQGKPFVVVLNCVSPETPEAQSLAEALRVKHGVTVLCMNVMKMSAQEANSLMEHILMEFPVRSIEFELPSWMQGLSHEHWLIQRLMQPLASALPAISEMKDYGKSMEALTAIEGFEAPRLESIDMGTGTVNIALRPEEGLFYKVLGEECGYEIEDDFHLISTIKDFVSAKREYDRIANALYSVKNTGYGLVPPQMDEMELEAPEIVQQGSRYGVRLKAHASGMHLIRVDIDSEISPLVGSEEQSQELVNYLKDAFDKDPAQLWQTNIFGKPLYDLVREGMSNKVNSMPEQAQQKLQETLQRIVNHGCNGLICIML